MASAMFTVFLPFLLLTIASPAAAATAQIVTYNFDSLVNPVGSAAPLVQIGKYKHLDFSLRLGSRTNITAIEGVVPHTPPNYAIFGNESTVLSGPATINQTSSISSFDLDSFWYGCELATATDNVNIPLNCTVDVVGLNSKGRRVARQTLKYTAHGGIRSQAQVQAKFTSFKRLSSVVFNYDSADVLQTGVVFDNFVATLHRN